MMIDSNLHHSDMIKVFVSHLHLGKDCCKMWLYGWRVIDVMDFHLHRAQPNCQHFNFPSEMVGVVECYHASTLPLASRWQI
jgi:hypothetical protein